MGAWSNRAIGGASLVVFAFLGPQAQAAESAAEAEDLCAPASDFWTRAARWRFARYCAQLDRARSSLGSRPKLALELSRAALASHPKDSSAQVIHAHALLALGQVRLSHQAFVKWEETHTATPHSHVTHLWMAAQAAVRAGDAASALKRYRRLLLLLNEFSYSDQRGRILVEACVSAVFAGAPHAEAVGYLRRSEREYAPSMHLLRMALSRVLSPEVDEAVSRSEARLAGRTELYWALSQQVGLLEELDTQQGEPELGWIALPAGTLHWLLGRLAATHDPARADEHRRLLICSRPTELAGLLSSWSGVAPGEVKCEDEEDQADQEEKVEP